MLSNLLWAANYKPFSGQEKKTGLVAWGIRVNILLLGK